MEGKISFFRYILFLIFVEPTSTIQSRAVVVYPGQRVQINCSLNSTRTFSQWAFASVGSSSSPTVLVSAEAGLGPQFKNRFDFRPEDPDVLTIRSAEQRDAGRYICRNLLRYGYEGNISEFSTEIVFLYGNMSCFPSYGSFVTEGESLTLQCSVSYKGNLGAVMEWRGNDNGSIDSQQTTNYTAAETDPHSTTATSTLRLMADSSTNELKYICTAHFNTSAINGLNDTSPILSWTSPQFIVQYKPRDIKITPAGEDGFYVGDSLICSADASPSAQFKWKLGTNKTSYYGSRFIIEEPNAFDEAILLTCTAENSLGSANISKLITIRRYLIPKGLAVTIGVFCVPLLIIAALAVYVKHLKRKRADKKPADIEEMKAKRTVYSGVYDTIKYDTIGGYEMPDHVFSLDGINRYEMPFKDRVPSGYEDPDKVLKANDYELVLLSSEYTTTMPDPGKENISSPDRLSREQDNKYTPLNFIDTGKRKSEKNTSGVDGPASYLEIVGDEDEMKRTRESGISRKSPASEGNQEKNKAPAANRNDLDPGNCAVFDAIHRGHQKMVGPGRVRVMHRNREFIQLRKKIGNEDRFFKAFEAVRGNQLNVNKELVIDRKAFLQFSEQKRLDILKHSNDSENGRITETQFEYNVKSIRKEYGIKFERQRAKALTKIKKAFQVASVDDIEIGGKRIFSNLEPKDIDRLNQVLTEAGKNYGPDQLRVARAMADKVGCEDVTDFAAVAEFAIRRTNDEAKLMKKQNPKPQKLPGVSDVDYFFKQAAEKFLNNKDFQDKVLEEFGSLHDRCDRANSADTPMFKTAAAATNHYDKHSLFPKIDENNPIPPERYFEIAGEMCGGPLKNPKWTQDGNRSLKVTSTEP